MINYAKIQGKNEGEKKIDITGRITSCISGNVPVFNFPGCEHVGKRESC